MNTNNNTNFDPQTITLIPQKTLYDSIHEDLLFQAKKIGLFPKTISFNDGPVDYSLTSYGQHEDVNNRPVKDEDTLSMA